MICTQCGKPDARAVDIRGTHYVRCHDCLMATLEARIRANEAQIRANKRESVERMRETAQHMIAEADQWFDENIELTASLSDFLQYTYRFDAATHREYVDLLMARNDVARAFLRIAEAAKRVLKARKYESIYARFKESLEVQREVLEVNYRDAVDFQASFSPIMARLGLLKGHANVASTDTMLTATLAKRGSAT